MGWLYILTPNCCTCKHYPPSPPSPLVLGNLWDVTDRDIDRFTKALLQSWLSASRGSALLDHMASSRQATYLKHLIGAAPVVYGLPVSLK